MFRVYNAKLDKYKLADENGDLTPEIFERAIVCGEGDYLILNVGKGDFVVDKNTILACANNVQLLGKVVNNAGTYDYVGFSKVKRNGDYVFKFYMANQGMLVSTKPAIKSQTAVL